MARRFTYAAMLLFLFCLPLHFHFSLAPQLTNQCSCLQGARAQFVVAESAPTVVPAPQFGFLLDPQLCEWISTASRCQYVRGPPLSV
jgi:hypothetical protein